MTDQRRAFGKVRRCNVLAGVAELVDAPDLGSGGESCGGSSPSARTIFDHQTLMKTRRI